MRTPRGRSRFLYQVGGAGLRAFLCALLLAAIIVPAASAQPPGAPRARTSGAGAQTPASSGASTEELVVTPDGQIFLNYADGDLVEIIKSLGKLTGKNFDIDSAIPKNTVTIISNDSIPVEMAYTVLENILATRGIELVPVIDGNIVKVIQTNKLPSQRPMIVPGEEIPAGHDNIVTYIYPLQFADAAELQPMLAKFGSQENVARVDSYARTNMLILTDTVDGIKSMLKFLEQVDLGGYDTKLEIMQLKFTRAETIATQITDVLLGPEGQAGQARGARPGTGAAPAPTVQPRTPRTSNVPGQQTGMAVGSREQVLRITPDERMNALIVVASAPIMEQVRDLVDKLDASTPYETNNMQIIALLNADAEKVANVLNGLTSTAPRAANAGGGGGGGAPGGGGMGGGAAGSAEVQPFEKKVQITPYPESNMLLIVAAPQDFKVLREVIQKLDVPQRQVHVEAVIMDVIINDSFSLTAETAALTGNDAFALNNVVRLANIIAQGPLAAAGEGTALGIVDGTTEIPVPTADGGFTTQTIPNVPLLLNALEKMTNLDILSQPSLTTVDNQESNIVVGQEVPFISGGTRQADQTSVGSNFFSTRVERKDVGIKLTAKPQISEGDNVYLELEVEVSDVIASPVGADVNIVGPTLQKSNVKNQMVIQDGATGVMGGLISEATDHSRTQAPVLGDIPLLGFLFRNKSDARRKRNLVVLVTPYIVKERTDSGRLMDYRLDEFTRSNLDAIFEKGFIKKVRNKQYMRSKHSPSANHVQELAGPKAFEKGAEPPDREK
jgi:general secretion pathway protein D